MGKDPAFSMGTASSVAAKRWKCPAGLSDGDDQGIFPWWLRVARKCPSGSPCDGRGAGGRHAPHARIVTVSANAHSLPSPSDRASPADDVSAEAPPPTRNATTAGGRRRGIFELSWDSQGRGHAQGRRDHPPASGHRVAVVLSRSSWSACSSSSAPSSAARGVSTRDRGALRRSSATPAIAAAPPRPVPRPSSARPGTGAGTVRAHR